MKDEEVISPTEKSGCRVGSSDGLDAARKYLESYRHGCRMLRADKYAREYFDDGFERDAQEKRSLANSPSRPCNDERRAGSCRRF